MRWIGELVYEFNTPYHGSAPKRSLEGPQICTQAKELSPEVIRGKDFVAVRQSFTLHAAAPARTTGLDMDADDRVSAGKRYFISMRPDRRGQLQRRDVPAHRHAGAHQAQSGRHVQRDLPELPGADQSAAHDTTPSRPARSSRTSRRTTRFNYRRDETDQPPQRFIRAYRLRDPKTRQSPARGWPA